VDLLELDKNAKILLKVKMRVKIRGEREGDGEGIQVERKGSMRQS